MVVARCAHGILTIPLVARHVSRVTLMRNLGFFRNCRGSFCRPAGALRVEGVPAASPSGAPVACPGPRCIDCMVFQRPRFRFGAADDRFGLGGRRQRTTVRRADRRSLAVPAGPECGRVAGDCPGRDRWEMRRPALFHVVTAISGRPARPTLFPSGDDRAGRGPARVLAFRRRTARGIVSGW